MPLLKLTQHIDESDLYARFDKDDIVEICSTDDGDGGRVTWLELGNGKSYQVKESPDDILAQLHAQSGRSITSDR